MFGKSQPKHNQSVFQNPYGSTHQQSNLDYPFEEEDEEEYEDEDQGTILLEEDFTPDYEPNEEEILEYAEYLGMDLNQDKEFLYIAREGLKTQLPKPWVPMRNSKGEIFYVNTQTQEKTFVHPCDSFYKNMFFKEKQKQLKNESMFQHQEKGKNNSNEKSGSKHTSSKKEKIPKTMLDFKDIIENKSGKGFLNDVMISKEQQLQNSQVSNYKGQNNSNNNSFLRQPSKEQQHQQQILQNEGEEDAFQQIEREIEQQISQLEEGQLKKLKEREKEIQQKEVKAQKEQELLKQQWQKQKERMQKDKKKFIKENLKKKQEAQSEQLLQNQIQELKLDEINKMKQIKQQEEEQFQKQVNTYQQSLNGVIQDKTQKIQQIQSQKNFTTQSIQQKQLKFQQDLQFHSQRIEQEVIQSLSSAFNKEEAKLKEETNNAQNDILSANQAEYNQINRVKKY